MWNSTYTKFHRSAFVNYYRIPISIIKIIKKHILLVTINVSPRTLFAHYTYLSTLFIVWNIYPQKQVFEMLTANLVKNGILQ